MIKLKRWNKRNQLVEGSDQDTDAVTYEYVDSISAQGHRVTKRNEKPLRGAPLSPSLPPPTEDDDRISNFPDDMDISQHIDPIAQDPSKKNRV